MTKRILLACLIIAALLVAVLPAAANDGDQVFTGVVIESHLDAPHYELQTATNVYVLIGSQDFGKYAGQAVTVHGTVSNEPNIYMRGALIHVNSIAAGAQGGAGILPITDLGYEHWAASAILYIKNFGVFGPGIPAREALDRPVTPAQFREWSKLVLNATTELETGIIDDATPASGWQAYVNRENAVVALLKLIGEKGAIAKGTGKEVLPGAAADFKDADRYMSYRDLGVLSKLAANAGLISDTNGLRPYDALTMAEAATILMRIDTKYDMSGQAYSDAERYRIAALDGDKRVGEWYDKHDGRFMVRYLDGKWEMQQTTADSPVQPVWTEIPGENALRIMKTHAAFSFEVKGSTIECTFTQELGAGPHRLVVTLNAMTLAVDSVTEYDR